MIIDLQRRIHECGRIRIGQQVPTGTNGRTRPEKLTTFRLTSSDRSRLDDAAALWGGTVAPWKAPAGPQWEVVTETDTLSVVVPPSDIAFSQFYELWSAGGCQRRCDGVTESIADRACVCDPDRRECQVHTRLSVMLADLPGLGVWRIDTSGHYAAVELNGAVSVIHSAAGRGVLLPARLRLEQRQVKRFDDRGKPQTRNFAVPVLDVQITPAQLLSGERITPLNGTRPEITTGGEPATASGELPRLTPVPPATGPGPSIAEQAAAPPVRSRRTATEIPRSGRDRRTTTEEPADDRMTQPQQRKLFALIREHDVDHRNDWASGVLNRDITSFGQLSRADAGTLIDTLDQGEQPA